ncbi:unnamed protein product [Ectocarpus sp. CCAP 1310/34]|nr:unnamed protein product [Ectocarpus sp. CCAP 1310/34]
MTDLFEILRFVDGKQGDGAGEGRAFDTADVPSSGEHFISRMREYLPLFEVWVRDVRCKPPNRKNPGARTTAKVYDIPITQVLAFLLTSKESMEEVVQNPGGAVHLFPVPTRPVGNARRNNMHGTIVQAMSQFNTDGFLTSGQTRLYVGEVAMCDLRQPGAAQPRQVPCRVVRSFFDEQTRRLVVVVRCFRDAHEVLGYPYTSPDFTRDGLVRLLEEVGTASEVVLRDEARRQGWSFSGEGFVEKRRGGRWLQLEDPLKKGWRRAGGVEEDYPNMRDPDVLHNTHNLPYIGLPVGLFADDFNVFDMSNPTSKTEVPCGNCAVRQSNVEGETGGDLGDRNFDIVKYRRKRGEVELGRSELEKLGFGTPQAVALSKKLGIVEPHPSMRVQPRLLWDLTSHHSPMVSEGPELLHLDFLNHLGGVQTFFLGLLSPAGRAHVTGVVRQRGGLYGPGALPLKDPIKDYTGYTGSHKGLFGSVQLIVFRGLLASVGAMRHYLSSNALRAQNIEVWGRLNDEGVLDRLRQYLQASSALTFAARGQVFSDSDLVELHVRAGDMVENSKLTLGREGVKTTMHQWLHVAESIRAHGRPQDANVGEAGHQTHKRSRKSSSNRDPAAHHARRTNTFLALHRLTSPEPYTANRYSYSSKTKVTEQVTSGPGCRRILAALGDRLRGGLNGVVDADASTTPTASMKDGKYQGSAKWQATILGGGDLACSEDGGGSVAAGAKEPWEVCVSEGPVRPHAGAILRANAEWFSCGRSDGALDDCADARCPLCWEGGHESLKARNISCSRFKHGVPPKTSSGLGRFKGGDVKKATATGPTPRHWCVGDGRGESVEIFTSPEAKRKDLSGDGHVTLGLILYFFDLDGNPRPGPTAAADPMMEYVLVYEYVTRGAGRSKKADSVTLHPTYWLQGGGNRVPSVYPVDAIRRHVHMYHLCPVSHFEPRAANTSALAETCGLRDDDTGKGGNVWKHHYILAAAKPPSGQRDAYMLNEHWRGAFQDGVV